jgi:putative membrane protein
VTAAGLAVGIAGGLLGGLAGAGAMSAAHTLVAPPRPTEAEEPDATVKVADRLSRAVRRRPLARAEEPAAATAVHYGFGAAMGALYGALTTMAPGLAASGGLGFGAAVWLGAHATVVPALGLARSPLRRPAGQEALELGLHLLYGVTTEVIRRLTVAVVR